MVNRARQHKRTSTWASAYAGTIVPYPFARENASRVDAGTKGFGLIVVLYIEEKPSGG